MMDLLQIEGDWLFSLSSFLGGGALGGLVSAVVNRKENRRIRRSEAVQSEAAAKKEDASAATEMMGLLERTVEHMERMNDYNKTNAESLLLMVRERDQLNDRPLRSTRPAEHCSRWRRREEAGDGLTGTSVNLMGQFTICPTGCIMVVVMYN